MKTKVKLYKVSDGHSHREVNARNKKEAVTIFKQQIKGYSIGKIKVV